MVFSDAHFDCASSGATLAALPLSWPELFAKDPLLVFGPQFWCKSEVSSFRGTTA